MKLSELYAAAIAVGMRHDPRGQDAVRRALDAAGRKHDELKEKDREFFDPETLTNPYADSRILHGTGDEEVSCLLAGIDIEPAELLLADRLRERGTKVDLVLGHHPGGRALAEMFEVMKMQAEILHLAGVSISTAEDLLDDRIKEVERRLLPGNHQRVVDAARLLRLPLVCLHTPADNMVAAHLQQRLDAEKPHTLADLVDLLLAEPEYREGARVGQGPKIVLGSKPRTAGRTFVDMTGGTSGPKDIFDNLEKSGVNTLVGMHITDEHRKEAQKHHLNVVIAGHISSDTLGVNLLLDGVQKETGVALQVLECSGFRRFPRP
jgi:hypothetical protein